MGNLTLRIGKATFTYGQFVTAALSFLISAVVVYFILVLPVSRLLQLLSGTGPRPRGIVQSAR